MQYYMSEEEAQYMDNHHGQFSKKLAEYAISCMEYRDEATQTMKRLAPHTIEEMEENMKKYGIKVKEECIYTAWYLYNMTYADYRKALPTNDVKCYFVDETINDPDCDPVAVLACFHAKMDVKGLPINWERFI
jgi:hypothetical protein